VNQLWDKCGNMTIEMVQARLAGIQRPGWTKMPGLSLREAAVLVPLVCEDCELHLLFTRRTDLVHDHKGQVAFPGGSVEPQDSTLEDTALRETYEEIGIPPSEIRILGQLALFPTITGFLISPVVGMIPWPYDLRLSPQEVSRVFTIPLAWLANPSNRVEKEMVLPDGRNERVVFFNTYDGEKLWGATARITLNFLKLLDPG
jgi:8-oxo-dGTP pyrophosphatase MutT (NUDIX family)